MSKLGDRIVKSPPVKDDNSGMPAIDPVTTGEYNELRRELIDLRAYRDAANNIGFVQAANKRAKEWQNATSEVTAKLQELNQQHAKLIEALQKFVGEVLPLGGESRISALAIEQILNDFNDFAL